MQCESANECARVRHGDIQLQMLHAISIALYCHAPSKVGCTGVREYSFQHYTLGNYSVV